MREPIVINSMQLSSNQLAIIESGKLTDSVPTGVSILKRCGKIKFVSKEIEFQVYDDNGDSYVKAHAPDVQENEELIDIDSIIRRSGGRIGIRGSVTGGLRDLVIQRRNSIERPISLTNGQFEIDDLRGGLYTVFSPSNPMAKSRVAVASSSTNIYEQIVNTRPIFYDQEKKSFFNWYFRVKSELGPDPDLDYELYFVNNLGYSFYVYDLPANLDYTYVTDGRTGVELYEDNYDAYFIHRANDIVYRSNTGEIRFP